MRNRGASERRKEERELKVKQEPTRMKKGMSEIMWRIRNNVYEEKGV